MSIPTPKNELLELVSSIHFAAKDLIAFLEKHQLKQLSINTPAPNVELTLGNAPNFDAKSFIIEAAERLVRLKLANHVPLEGTTTYTAISLAVAKPEFPPALVARIIEHATSYGLFNVQPGGLVAHNSMSALLATDPDLEAWMDLSATVAYPAGASIPKGLGLYGYSMEADEAPYGLSIGRKVSQFQRFREADGAQLHEMFARAMRGISAGGAYDFRHAADGGYPWHMLEQKCHLIVDVGGGPGHVSVALAKKYPKLRFEVQDLPETVAVGERSCPDELKSRIKIRPHNFMKPQPEHSVGTSEGIVYFCRFILHDWSDKYARIILQGLASSLRPQDRIIVNEVVVPDPGTETRERERRMHDRDMLMLLNLNGRERTKAAFEDLYTSLTPKLRVQRIYRPSQGELSLIEITQADAPIQLNGDTSVNGVGGDHASSAARVTSASVQMG